MNERIEALADLLAALIQPAHSGKDRAKQAVIKTTIEGSLTHLCEALVEHARNPATDTPADTAGEESPQ